MKSLNRLPIRIAVCAVLAVAGYGASPPEAPPSLRLDSAPESPHYGTVEVTGLDRRLLAELEGRGLEADTWPAVLAVYTGTELPAAGSGKPPVAGSYTITAGGVRFHPRFPLVEGLSYVATFDPGGGHAPITAVLALPAPAARESTYVTRIYPTTDEVPENLLRLYVHFSAPMSRGEAYRHVRIVDEATGQEVEAPFVEITEELWDPGMRRLTLFFDPGRIKRGLRPHLEAGPPLVEGGAYRLVVDAAWPDAHGEPLRESFEKRFRVLGPDRTSPDPEDWRLEAPDAGSRQAAVLRFPEPVDHALMTRVVRVLDAGGRPVDGTAQASDEERRFEFVPSAPWTAGVYTVEVETILEDLAGNNLRNVFDVDLESDPGEQTDDEVIRMELVVAARPKADPEA